MINYDVRLFIHVEGQKIVSGDKFKLLGYYMGRRPRPDIHVRERIRKFGARAWILRILKHAGIPEASLTQVFCSLIRPILEYPSAAFHTTMSEEMSENIERLQRVTLKSIYGLDKSYSHCLEVGPPQTGL